MEFNPGNAVVQLCIQGMDMEAKGKQAEAAQLFQQAWEEATNDFEQFTAAYYVARHQNDTSDKLQWYINALQHAERVEGEMMNSALATLHSKIAECYDELNDAEQAKSHKEQARALSGKIYDEGPFYHGTRADLQVGDLLVAGHNSNYQSDIVMNHIYFTAQIHIAGLAAALAADDGDERIIVEPTAVFEHDPNVTDKKFPGNPTRSYRTEAPLKIIGEVKDWARLPQEVIQQYRDRLANSKGEIIN